MSNTKYPLGVTNVMDASINFSSDTIKLALIGSGYVYSATHQFYSDLTPASNVIGTPVAFTGKTVTNGVFNATSPVTFTSVTGSQVAYLVIYKDTGTTTTSPLIAYIDTATGLPITPNGGNISIVLDSGINKILAF